MCLDNNVNALCVMNSTLGKITFMEFKAIQATVKLRVLALLVWNNMLALFVVFSTLNSFCLGNNVNALCVQYGNEFNFRKNYIYGVQSHTSEILARQPDKQIDLASMF